MSPGRWAASQALRVARAEAPPERTVAWRASAPWDAVLAKHADQDARGRPTLFHLALLLAAPGEEGSRRRRVFALIERYPGLHQREIARRLETTPHAAEHHLRHLVRSGLVARQEEGGYVRYYVRVHAPDARPKSVGTEDRRRLAVLRQARPLQVVAHLLTRDQMAMGELAQAVGLSPGTLTHHVAKLEKAGIVARVVQGRQRFARLVDRDDTVRLLLAHEPPADLVAGFEEIWDEVGF